MRRDIRGEHQAQTGAAQSRPQVVLQGRLQFGGIIGAGKPEFQLDGRHIAMQRDGLDRLGLSQGLAKIGIGKGAQRSPDGAGRIVKRGHMPLF